VPHGRKRSHARDSLGDDVLSTDGRSAARPAIQSGGGKEAVITKSWKGLVHYRDENGCPLQECQDMLKHLDATAKRSLPEADANKSSRDGGAVFQDYRTIHFVLPLPGTSTPEELNARGLPIHHGALDGNDQDKQITVVPFGDANYVVWIGSDPTQRLVPVRKLQEIVRL